MILYFKNQTELAEALKVLIDKYWELEIKEDELIETLGNIKENNKELIYKDGDYVAIVKQRLGVKRLRVLEIIIGK